MAGVLHLASVAVAMLLLFTCRTTAGQPATATQTATPAPATAAILGTIKDGGVSRVGVAVVLHWYPDAACAELADRAGAHPGAVDEQLAACRRVAATATTDAQGGYAFTGLPPGRYSLSATWDGSAAQPPWSMRQQIGVWDVVYLRAYPIGGGTAHTTRVWVYARAVLLQAGAQEMLDLSLR